MEAEVRNQIEKMVQNARHLLEQEIHDQLEGVYGLHKDGNFEDVSSLPKIKDNSDALKERKGFEYFISNEVSQGTKKKDAVNKLVLGLSFTHFNRLIALKLMERRKVIRESISRKTDSNGFKFFLADYPEQMVLWTSGKNDEVYKNFLLHQYGLISEEIHVLFDPEDVSNLIFPKPRTLYDLLDLINQEPLADLWEEDETIGWIYQYFTPKELRKQARSESPAPRNSYELAFRNQFYTPRYVVRFLTDNTLGRTWYEMRRGDTKLTEICEYMVRRSNEIFLEKGEETPEIEENSDKTQEELLNELFYIPYRAKKDPREIKTLDPATGSGHFLLYCFDILQIIYEEAYEDPDLSSSLKADYPSIEEYKKAIPELILRHNLYGIDIDLRATQIASLAIWLRAQKAYQEMGLKAEERPKITKSNIVCAEPMPGNETVLKEFKKNLQPAVLGDFVTDVWNEMKLAGEAGSLLKIEETITNSVKEAKEAWLTRPKDIQLDLFGNKKSLEQMRFNLRGIKDRMFWEEAEELLIDSLKKFAEEASNGDSYPRKLFAENAEHGFAFIDVISKKYDVVLMNPPFGDSSTGSKTYIDKKYPRTKNDLYAAFVERMLELLHERGFIGIISSRTGFFLPAFTSWREEILMKESSLHSVADLGYGVLEAMVETAAYTIEKIPSIGRKAVFFRLIEDKDDKKGEILLETLGNHNKKKMFVVRLDSFTLVPKSPFSYWVSDILRNKFKVLQPFERNEGDVRKGLGTCEDFRFIRLNWEIPCENVTFLYEKQIKNVTSKEIVELYKKKTHSRRWSKFVKGGEYSPYYSNVHLLVNWSNEGHEIRNLYNNNGKLKSRPQNRDYYYFSGLTWSRRTTSKFSIRALPIGTIFSDLGNIVLPYKEQLKYSYLGLFSSNVYYSLLKLSLGAVDAAARTYDVGIIQRAPIPVFNKEISDEFEELVIQCINIKSKEFSYDETTHVFSLPSLSSNKSHSLQEFEYLHNKEKAIREENFSKIQKQIDEIAYNAYKICPDDMGLIEEENLVDEENFEDNEKNLLTNLQNFLQWAVGIVFGRWDIRMGLDVTIGPKPTDPFDPLPVCSPGMLLSPDGLPAREGQIVSEEWLRARENVLDIPENVLNPTILDSEYPLKIDWDGILVDDPGHIDDILERVKDVFGLIWKDKAQDIENEACAILSVKSLRDYFRKKFFDFHIKRYSKSRRMAPIYWQLSSKNKNYSLWIYYHRLTSDTLFLSLRKYIDPKVEYEETRLLEMKQKLETDKESLPRSQITKIEKEIEKKADFVVELKEFRDTMEKIAQSGYDPVFDDGVILNMAPLHKVIPWKEPAKYWKELEAGDYDWAHITMKYWPERVKEKCRKDKSLAIAHGMEGLYDGNSN